METWGKESTHDVKGGHLPAVRSAEVITAFARELVEAIEMKPYGEPQVVHFAAHDPTKGGYTLVQLIETSSITGHFVDSNGDFYLNVFSCKDFEPKIVDALILKYFKPQNITSQVYLRQA